MMMEASTVVQVSMISTQHGPMMAALKLELALRERGASSGQSW